MFGFSRAWTAFVAASIVVTGVPVAAAAATSTTPSSSAPKATTTVPGGSSTTTVPVTTPPAFSLPSDFGYAVLEEMNRGRADLRAAQADMKQAKAGLRVATKRNDAVQAELARLDKKSRDTAEKLAASRDRLRRATNQAYMHAGSGEIFTALDTFVQADSALEAGSQLHLMNTYSNDEKDALDEYTALKKRVDVQLQRMGDRADDAARLLAAAKHKVADVGKLIADAKKRILDAASKMTEFHKAATSALSPILGPSRLTAWQMAAFVGSNGGHPHITVPLEQLAQDYLDEGVRTGVRGDVAFAQSILETGSFANPGASATENNFAGIGWCDSCAHGFNFPDARTGVRAQLQLLRTYVDPAFPGTDYKDPILMKGTLSLGFRGKVQTWWDLWGTWATAAMYGQRVYDIYERMVAFADAHPELQKLPAPKAGPLPGGTEKVDFSPMKPGTKKP